MPARALVPRRRRVRQRLSLITAATVGLPLPRSGDWRPADGWLPAVLPACNGGLPLAVWLAWSHFSREPARPIRGSRPWRFFAVAAVSALADLAVADAYAWRPATAAGPSRMTVVSVFASSVISSMRDGR